MESSYGIGVKNRYELFYDDEEDPTELLRQQEEEKERRKAEKITSKDKPKRPGAQGSQASGERGCQENPKGSTDQQGARTERRTQGRQQASADSQAGPGGQVCRPRGAGQPAGLRGTEEPAQPRGSGACGRLGKPV
uniref:Putative vasa intronic protein n=1 Tax=Ixodes ricinus TaxID=34613 RepID=A0A0K8RBH2_IXORI